MIYLILLKQVLCLGSTSLFFKRTDGLSLDIYNGVLNKGERVGYPKSNNCEAILAILTTINSHVSRENIMKIGVLLGAIIFLLLIHSIEIGELSAIEYGGYTAPFFLMSIMMLILGCVLLYQSYVDFRLKQTKKWPHVMGRITEIEFKESFLSGKTIKLYYSYLVRDVNYRNDIFDYNQKNATEGLLRMMPGMRDFTGDIYEMEGKMIRVYYHPKTPWKSVLSNKIEQDQSMVAIPALMIIITCLYVLYSLYMVLNE